MNRNKIRTIKYLIPILIPIAIAIATYVLNLETRSITYEITKSYQLINPTFIQNKNVSIYYKTRKIENLSLTSIVLKNSGNRPIKRTDFDSDIEIKVENNVHIYEASIINSSPNNIRSEIKTHNNKIIIAPMLLNPNDYITICIYSLDAIDRVQITGRIVGVRMIEQKHIQYPSNKKIKRSFATSMYR